MRIISYTQAKEIGAFRSDQASSMQQRNKISGMVGTILDKKMPLLGADKEAVVFNIVNTIYSSRVSVAVGNTNWNLNPEDRGVYPCLNGFCKFPSENAGLPARKRQYQFARQVENFVACAGKCIAGLIKTLEPRKEEQAKPPTTA